MFFPFIYIHTFLACTCSSWLIKTKSVNNIRIILNYLGQEYESLYVPNVHQTEAVPVICKCRNTRVSRAFHHALSLWDSSGCLIACIIWALLYHDALCMCTVRLWLVLTTCALWELAQYEKPFPIETFTIEAALMRGSNQNMGRGGSLKLET